MRRARGGTGAQNVQVIFPATPVADWGHIGTYWLPGRPSGALRRRGALGYRGPGLNIGTAVTAGPSGQDEGRAGPSAPTTWANHRARPIARLAVEHRHRAGVQLVAKPPVVRKVAQLRRARW